MIYLISGASRSGKSKVASMLHSETGISYLPLDSVMMAFMIGVKDLGIHDKLWPHEIAQKLWGFLEAFIRNLNYNEMDYIIEGEAMKPSLLDALVKDLGENIKVVFIGYDQADPIQKVEECKTYASGEKDWLVKESEEHIKDHIVNMIGYSKTIKEECFKYSIPYFDISKNFNQVIDEVLKYLKAK